MSEVKIGKEFTKRTIETTVGNCVFVRYHGEVDLREADRLFGRYRLTRNYPLAVASLRAKRAYDNLKEQQYNGYFVTSCIIGASVVSPEATKFEEVVHSGEVISFFKKLPDDRESVFVIGYSGGHTSQDNIFHTTGYLLRIPLLPHGQRHISYSTNFLDAMSSLINHKQCIIVDKFDFQQNEQRLFIASAADLFDPNTTVAALFHGEYQDIYNSIAQHVLLSTTTNTGFIQ